MHPACPDVRSRRPDRTLQATEGPRIHDLQALHEEPRLCAVQRHLQPWTPPAPLLRPFQCVMTKDINPEGLSPSHPHTAEWTACGSQSTVYETTFSYLCFNKLDYFLTFLADTHFWQTDFSFSIFTPNTSNSFLARGCIFQTPYAS